MGDSKLGPLAGQSAVTDGADDLRTIRRSLVGPVVAVAAAGAVTAFSLGGLVALLGFAAGAALTQLVVTIVAETPPVIERIGRQSMLDALFDAGESSGAVALAEPELRNRRVAGG
jgi:hypothetical protein